MQKLELRPEAVLVYSFAVCDYELKEGWCESASAPMSGPAWKLTESIRLELSKYQAYGEVRPHNDDDPYAIFHFVYQNPANMFHKWLKKNWGRS